MQKEAGVAFKQNRPQIKEYYQRSTGTMQNDKGFNSSRRQNNAKYVSTEQWSFKIFAEKTDRMERRNRQTYNYRLRLQYSFFQ